MSKITPELSADGNRGVSSSSSSPSSPSSLSGACGRALPELRHPDEVMTLARLGSFFPHRLSFMRSFIRRVAKEKAVLSMPICALDADGYGHVVLTLPVSGHDYSLIAYSRPLNADERTDRVIATKWDASFCLFDGIPNDDDIAALADQVTQQEAGRYHHKVLTLSRANKSLRLFHHVVESLAAGVQPDLEQIKAIGYLMRTTAVYGNGKFGIADRDLIADRPGLEGPFQAEMLTVFLIREFTLFLADYCAHQTSGEVAAKLAPSYRRYLGIGNSTGLGMAPFLVNHPALLHSWIMAREVAFARAQNVAAISDVQRRRFDELLDRACQHSGDWQVEDHIQMDRIIILRDELATLKAGLAANPLPQDYPFRDAVLRCQSCSAETQELMVSLLIELIPDQVDGLADCMANPNAPRLIPSMKIAELKDILAEHYRWVDDIDLSGQDADAHFWYTSEEKLEPRLGRRYEEPGQELEMPFNIPRYVDALKTAIAPLPDHQIVAELLMVRPELRHIVRRVQTTAIYPYAEIRDNLVGDACRPIDLLRCKLSFFGASKFDPKSDRWTRITLYQGAPTAADLNMDIGSDQVSSQLSELDDWIFALSPAKV